MLSNMFTAFDKLTDRFSVYKVETIGELGEERAGQRAGEVRAKERPGERAGERAGEWAAEVRAGKRPGERRMWRWAWAAATAGWALRLARPVAAPSGPAACCVHGHPHAPGRAPLLRLLPEPF